MISKGGIQKGLKKLLIQNKDLTPRYLQVRELSRNLRNPIVYDITSKCNLFCEGCYYFEGNKSIPEDSSVDEWTELMRKAKEDKISYAYIGGAEPALSQDKLHIANKYIPYGSIATNGTILIDKAITYRVIISVWGDEEITTYLRGGNVFWKAVKNYRDDSRALFAYTITNKNIEHIEKVANICQDNNIKLTFNMYSPTESYVNKLDLNIDNDNKFFRVSSTTNNLIFTNEQLKYCRDKVAKIVDKYPNTIIYPHSYNNEVTVNNSLFDLDSKGIATNCAGRHNGTHKTYLSDLQLSQEKCCTPNVTCKTCKQLTTYLPSRIRPTEIDISSRENFIKWLEICEFWAWFYLGKQCNKT